MYYVGIDISKYKHDCYIEDSNGVVIRDSFSFDNSKEGFNTFLSAIKSLDCSQEIRIGLEATGHYGIDLKFFLNDNNLTFMEFNPLLVKRIISSHTLRRTKTDKCDAKSISFVLARVTYKPYRLLSYHIEQLKSLTRARESFIKQRSNTLVQLTNILDRIFPEFKPFFGNKLTNTAIYILKKYKSVSKIAKWNNNDFEKMHNYSKCLPVYKFASLKHLAQNTIGHEDKTQLLLLQSILNIYQTLVDEIIKLESQINEIMSISDTNITSIPGISTISAATIIGEFGDVRKFDNPNQMLAFAGIEPSRNQSGTKDANGCMVKHGSGHLRYVLFNVIPMLCIHNATFYNYFLKKRKIEGKARRVAQSHVVKKLIRIIFALETNNMKFDSNKLR